MTDDYDSLADVADYIDENRLDEEPTGADYHAGFVKGYDYAHFIAQQFVLMHTGECDCETPHPEEQSDRSWQCGMCGTVLVEGEGDD